MNKETLTLEKVQEIFKSKPKMVAALNAAKDEAEVNAILKQNSLDFTLADVKALQDKVNLTDEEIQKVAGGFICCFIPGFSYGPQNEFTDSCWAACAYVGIGLGAAD